MIKLNNIKISSSDNTKVLIEDASLLAEPGQIVILEGENGAGKSTLLSSIMKNPQFKIVSGNIIINDEDVTEMETHDLAKRGVYLSMQHSPEIEGVSTIKMLYKSHKLLNPDSKISITDFKNELEKKCTVFDLDTDLLMRDLNVGFSGGQKKQADLMHMLALSPRVILLDEPDSGVDKDSVAKVYSVIEHFKNLGATIIITSHNTRIDELDINKRYTIKNKIVSLVD